MPLFFHIFCIVYYTIVGFVIGSFLNVVIYRLPKGESIVKGASHCTTCGAKIKRYDLIPVLSYFILRGRCRSCKARFSSRYAFVEFLIGLLFALCAIRFGYTYYTPLYTAFCCLLVVMAFIDMDTMEIPDRIHIAIGIIGIILIFTPDMPFYERVIGFFLVSVVLLLAAFLSKGGIGGGDIKLMAVSGLVLGWKNIVIGFIIGAVIAAVYGLILSKGKKENMKKKIPLGPFLAIGMVIALFLGNNIFTWYMGFLV